MRWTEVRDYHERHLVIAVTDCGYITLGDFRKENYRYGDDLPVVHNGKLKYDWKNSCNGVFSAAKYCDKWYLRCEVCEPVCTKCGKFNGSVIANMGVTYLKCVYVERVVTDDT